MPLPAILRNLALISLPITLAGCSAAFNAPSPSTSALPGAAIRGGVHGGEQGVVASHVYLFAVGTSGYGSAPTSLLNVLDPGVSTDRSGNGYVTTGANGAWSITSDYTCPTPSSQVYLLALGGNPGLTLGTNNAALALIAAVGSCSSLTGSTFIDINEITTIASAYALSPFTDFATLNVGSTSTNSLGLTNAFATVGNLVDRSTGLARTQTPNSLGFVPQAEIDSLANILSICVNSDGVTGGCPSLFAAATPSGGTAPANTLQVALNIARNPASQVTTLFNLQPANGAPFQPILPAAFNPFTGTSTGVPNDWTLAVVYASTSLNASEGIAADSQGNIWSVFNTTVTKLSPIGTILETVTGGQLQANNYNQTIAIDLNDRAVIDDNSYWVSLVDSLGNNTTLADSPPPLGSTNISGYGGVVVDASNNYWAGSAANNSSALVTFNAASGGNVNATYTGSGLVNPVGIAIDYAGSIWLTNSNSAFANPGTVSKFTSSGAAASGSPYSGGGMNGVAGIAIDASGNAWVTNTGTNTLTQLSSAGTPSSGSPYTGGGLHYPSAIAIDGDGHLWISNWQSSSASEFSSTGDAISPALGFYDGLSSGSSGGITIDASGNVWTADWSGYSIGPSAVGGISEIIGAAAPTVTPIALALQNHTIGTRP